MSSKFAIHKEIKQLINRSIDNLPSDIRKWAEAHLIVPRKIRFYADLDSRKRTSAWLVTDHIGKQDSSCRIIYDTDIQRFGLIVDLKDGKICCLGFYGDFDETVQSI